MLTCKMCGHEWYTRTGRAPKSCPKCGSARWNYVPVSECPVCSACPVHNPDGQAASPAPVRVLPPEHQAALDRFHTVNVPADKMTCGHCGNVWTPRTANPKQCPNCKTVLVAGTGTKPSAAKRAARALAAVGPITDTSSDFQSRRAVCDWEGKVIGWTEGQPLIRGNMPDQADHYPVFDGPTFDDEYFLSGWIRRDAL